MGNCEKTSCKINLRDYIGEFPDFPKEGILFRDISPLLASSAAFCAATEEMSARLHALVGDGADTVVGLDARGFVFGATLAQKEGLSFVMARKVGKLPGDVVQAQYSLEYGTDKIEIQLDKVQGKRVVLIDDLLATGGTLCAAAAAVRRAGGTVVGAIALIELTELNGRELLADIPVDTIIKY